jgi:hypothetical protein
VFIRIQFLQVAQGASALKAGGRTMPWTMAPLVVARERVGRHQPDVLDVRLHTSAIQTRLAVMQASPATIAGVLFSLGIFGAVFIRIQFLQVAQGASALKAGGRTMPRASQAMNAISSAPPPISEARTSPLDQPASSPRTMPSPLIAGAVVEGLSWQAIFWLNIPIGVLRLPPILEARTSPLDQPASSPRTMPKTTRKTPAIASPSRSPEPMMPLRLFRNRSFAVANIVGVLFSLGIFGAV